MTSTFSWVYRYRSGLGDLLRRFFRGYGKCWVRAPSGDGILMCDLFGCYPLRAADAMLVDGLLRAVMALSLDMVHHDFGLVRAHGGSMVVLHLRRLCGWSLGAERSVCAARCKNGKHMLQQFRFMMSFPTPILEPLLLF